MKALVQAIWFLTTAVGDALITIMAIVTFYRGVITTRDELDETENETGQKRRLAQPRQRRQYPAKAYRNSSSIIQQVDMRDLALLSLIYAGMMLFVIFIFALLAVNNVCK
jgi:hypothetical protein